MDRDETLKMVIECLEELVNNACLAEKIGPKTEPLKDLGLDSPDGIALACGLSEKFGFNIPLDVNPLVDDVKCRGRRVDEIGELINALRGKAGGDKCLKT